MKTIINRLLLTGLLAVSVVGSTVTTAFCQPPAAEAATEAAPLPPAEDPVVSHPSPVLRSFHPRFICVCPGYCPKPEPCKIPRPLCGPTTVNRQTTPWGLYNPFPVRGPFGH